MRWFLAFLLLSAILAAWNIEAADPAAPLSAQETRSAQKLYNTKCAKCHKFYNPDHYSAEDWKMWMEKMGKKSKLKPPQYELLSRYLETFRHTPSR
jgi:cytochrome c5